MLTQELLQEFMLIVKETNRKRNIKVKQHEKRLLRKKLTLDFPKGKWKQRVRTHKHHVKIVRELSLSESRKYKFTL